MAGHEDSDQLRIEALQAINADLLAALEYILGELQQGAIPNPDDPWWEQARAAIAKAKGSEHQ